MNLSLSEKDHNKILQSLGKDKSDIISNIIKKTGFDNFMKIIKNKNDYYQFNYSSSQSPNTSRERSPSASDEGTTHAHEQEGERSPSASDEETPHAREQEGEQKEEKPHAQFYKFKENALAHIRTTGGHNPNIDQLVNIAGVYISNKMAGKKDLSEIIGDGFNGARLTNDYERALAEAIRMKALEYFKIEEEQIKLTRVDNLFNKLTDQKRTELEKLVDQLNINYDNATDLNNYSILLGVYKSFAETLQDDDAVDQFRNIIKRSSDKLRGKLKDGRLTHGKIGIILKLVDLSRFSQPPLDLKVLDDEVFEYYTDEIETKVFYSEVFKDLLHNRRARTTLYNQITKSDNYDELTKDPQSQLKLHVRFMIKNASDNFFKYIASTSFIQSIISSKELEKYPIYKRIAEDYLSKKQDFEPVDDSLIILERKYQERSESQESGESSGSSKMKKSSDKGKKKALDLTDVQLSEESPEESTEDTIKKMKEEFNNFHISGSDRDKGKIKVYKNVLNKNENNIMDTLLSQIKTKTDINQIEPKHHVIYLYFLKTYSPTMFESLANSKLKDSMGKKTFLSYLNPEQPRRSPSKGKR